MSDKVKKYDLASGNLGGGLSIFARNVISGGDYATLVTLKGIGHLTDGLCITLDMRRSFNNQNAIQQVKDYLRSINPNISFSDEPVVNPPVLEDENLYTPEQVFLAVKSVDNLKCTGENLDVLNWALKKGYAVRLSHTQAHWTEKGADWSKSQKQALLAS